MEAILKLGKEAVNWVKRNTQAVVCDLDIVEEKFKELIQELDYAAETRVFPMQFPAAYLLSLPNDELDILNKDGNIKAIGNASDIKKLEDRVREINEES